MSRENGIRGSLSQRKRPWAIATSSDFAEFTENGVAVRGGDPKSHRDNCCHRRSKFDHQIKSIQEFHKACVRDPRRAGPGTMIEFVSGRSLEAGDRYHFG
jgi:hypothetical protein